MSVALVDLNHLSSYWLLLWFLSSSLSQPEIDMQNDFDHKNDVQCIIQWYLK